MKGQQKRNMLTEDWDELSIETLIRAVENGYSEGKDLEFKREQDPGNKGHKQTTVGEIVSLANSNGGDFVIGLVDEEGEASGVWPDQYDDVDNTQLRWIDIIKRNTDPEIPQHLIDIKALEVADEYAEYIDDDCPHQTGHILIIRVQRSWRAPHRETVNNQFYERSSGGKTELDTGAIRQAMFQKEVIIKKIREFRDDRLAAIRADDLVLPVKSHSKVVLHVFPSNALSTERLIDPVAASPDRGAPAPFILSPRKTTGNWSRYTVDGFFSAQIDFREECVGYTLTFQSGVIEAVTTKSYVEEGIYISAAHVQNCLNAGLPGYVDFLTRQGGTYPIYCFLSILDAGGIPVGQELATTRSHRDLKVIDRSVARLPAVQINSPQTNIESVINDLLDSLYNASGKVRPSEN